MVFELSRLFLDWIKTYFILTLSIPKIELQCPTAAIIWYTYFKRTNFGLKRIYLCTPKMALSIKIYRPNRGRNFAPYFGHLINKSSLEYLIN